MIGFKQSVKVFSAKFSLPTDPRKFSPSKVYRYTVLWPFLLLLLLVTSFKVRDFIQNACTCTYYALAGMRICLLLLYFSIIPLYLCDLCAPSLHMLLIRVRGVHCTKLISHLIWYVRAMEILIFVAAIDYENIFTTKISRFTVLFGLQ